MEEFGMIICSALKRARKRFGPEYAACLSNLRTGEGMVANLDFNYGRPWFVEFRPLYHNP